MDPASLRDDVPESGGLTPCSAATGIPGRPDTSSSPTCRARAALTKAFPGTPWSSARQTAAARPGTARDTTRPTRLPPAPPESQVGSHHHPTQGDPEPTEAFDTPAVTRHPPTVADGSRQTGSRSQGDQPYPSSGRQGCFVVYCPSIWASESGRAEFWVAGLRTTRSAQRLRATVGSSSADATL